jgi:hypothetical protein
MIDEECGAVGGIKIGQGNRSTRRKPDPVLLCPPQIPHDLTRARTLALGFGPGDTPPELWHGPPNWKLNFLTLL